MYTLYKMSSEFEGLKFESNKILREIVPKLKPIAKDVTIRSKLNLAQSCINEKKILLIKGGLLSFIQNGRALFYYEEGDLLGVEQLAGVNNIEISSEFAVTVDEYLIEDLIQEVSQSQTLFELWNHYLVCQIALYQALISCLVVDEANSFPLLKNFEKGEVVIQQGTEAQEVFTLLQGSADVFVDQVKVGEILTDETFGVISAITGAPRNATVIAREEVMVVALPKEKLVNLLKSRPESVIKLVEDMARVIGNLNNQVAGLASQKL